MQTRKLYHELTAKEKKAYIEENILQHLHESERAHGLTRVISIAHGYNGEADHALDILAFYARNGRFDESADELHRRYLHSLQFATPAQRKEKLKKELEDLDNNSRESEQGVQSNLPVYH